MYKIAVIGDYDSIYGFATLGLGIFPVKDREAVSYTHLDVYKRQPSSRTQK